MSDLNTIIAAAYRIFNKYKASIPLDACTHCCITKSQERDLVNLAVQHIPFDLLYDYNTAAKPTETQLEEFKHFLPKYLEYTSEFRFVHHSCELVFTRFDGHDKNEWTTDEQDLIQRFSESFFNLCLRTFPIPDCCAIDAILIMLWRMKIDIMPLLADWITTKSQDSILHFSNLVIGGFKQNKPDELCNSFADKELALLLKQWLSRDETKNHFAFRIEQFVMTPPPGIGESTLQELSWTYEMMKL